MFSKKMICAALVIAATCIGFSAFVYSGGLTHEVQAQAQKDARQLGGFTTPHDPPAKPQPYSKANEYGHQPTGKPFDDQMLAAAQAGIALTPVTVGLPKGQRFMYIIPAEDTEKMKLGRPGQKTYVTYEPPNSGLSSTYAPRKIHFLQPGYTPGTWEEVLVIQER